MNKTIEAVYENGVFRPLEPVSLPEGEHVQVAVPALSEEAKLKLKALEELVEACADMTEEEWRIFDEATTRRPMFGGRNVDL
jgi:predicted DNA-binding antitoxin AbrB/MazE fold protein